MDNCLPLTTAEPRGCLHQVMPILPRMHFQFKDIQVQIYLIHVSVASLPWSLLPAPPIQPCAWEGNRHHGPESDLGCSFLLTIKLDCVLCNYQSVILGLNHILVLLQIEISSMFFFSVVHFGRLFKRKLGKSPFHDHFEAIGLVFILL